MKKTDRKSSPSPVPRLNSLLHRLQKAPGQEDGSYLDELMLFLDNPPAKSGDRWKKGAEMCAAWGVPCSHASVYRLFRAYAVEWRSHAALEAPANGNPKAEVLEAKASHLVAQRTCEILADPDATPQNLISLARLDLRKKALELDRKKHEDSQRTPLQKALSVIQEKSFMNFHAQFAIDRLKEAWEKPKPSPYLKPFMDKLGLNPETGTSPAPPGSHV